jgi:hypothetical protein
MGCFFGIALILIIFAGAELFSGHIMYMTFGFLYKNFGTFQVIKDWVICWYGNLDDGKNKKRHHEMHPDLLVPVCLCLGGFRAQHREYVDIHDFAAWGSPG